MVCGCSSSRGCEAAQLSGTGGSAKPRGKSADVTSSQYRNGTVLDSLPKPPWGGRIVGPTGSLVLPAASVVLLYFGRGRDGGSLHSKFQHNSRRDHLSSDCARENVMTRWFKEAAFAGMLGFGAMSFLSAAAYGEPGVFDDRIVFGQSAAFDGPAAALGHFHSTCNGATDAVSENESSGIKSLRGIARVLVARCISRLWVKGMLIVL